MFPKRPLRTLNISSSTPSFRDLTLTCLKVGLLGFGGPAGQIALMHREFVEERRWLSEERYLHALSYCTLLPGPEAQQLATYAGWLMHGVRGGLIAGLLFVVPGAVLITLLAGLYVVFGQSAWMVGLFWGVKAAVLALVAQALWKLSGKVLKGWAPLLIAGLAFLALAILRLPFPIVILAAAAMGAMLMRTPAPQAEDLTPTTVTSWRKTVGTVVVWLVVWLAPLLIVTLCLGPDHWLSRLGGLFAGLAAVSFGGAYALLSWLQQQAVEVQGWLTTAQMVDGLGLAETTPGPLVLVNTFVGFLAGWNVQGGAGAALAGAAMATWNTFVPSFLYIFAGAPYAEALRRSPAAKAALAGVSAAVLGVIANLAVAFGGHVLFPMGMSLAGLDGWAVALAVLAAFALIRLKTGAMTVILLCATLGLARQWTLVGF